jgi:putative nucleotidyltransferase with HDIG domain
MADFRKIFPAIVLLALWVVLILSSYNIRKSLVPLEVLKKGTRQITMNKFDSKINLTSGDEFEELATDFNKMASELNKQFKTLDTKAEIDRAILSSLDARIIVETIIYRIYDWFDCDSVSIGLMDSKQGNTARIYSSSYVQRKELFENSIEFKPSDLETFNSHPEYMILYADKNRLSFLSTFVEQGIEYFLILPIFIKEHLKALITIGRSQSKFYNAEDIFQARQMADQVAVSLSNATLMEEMDNLGWGAIKALARTVDAKSSWTAGHSTRVAKMALRLGAELGISSKKLEDLHRAALLHDVGKIGIPLSILDKPGPLDDDEYAMVKKHPAIGARILEPIASYADIIPIVLQHHERFDGKGYPGGISGNEIDIGARILAVADVYDALISDRPYREGWAIENVIGLIRKEAGRQFDPDVAGIFLAIMRQRKTKAA